MEDTKLVRALPRGRYFPSGGEEALSRLIGATILEIGSPADGEDIEGGGLIIVYRKEDLTGRLVLAFDENAVWVERDEFPSTLA